MTSQQKSDFWNWVTICIGFLGFCSESWNLFHNEQGGRLVFVSNKFGFTLYDNEAAIMYASMLFLCVLLIAVGIRGLRRTGNGGA